jgi:hypothetical protein
MLILMINKLLAKIKCGIKSKIKCGIKSKIKFNEILHPFFFFIAH